MCLSGDNTVYLVLTQLVQSQIRINDSRNYFVNGIYGLLWELANAEFNFITFNPEEFIFKNVKRGTKRVRVGISFYGPLCLIKKKRHEQCKLHFELLCHFIY